MLSFSGKCLEGLKINYKNYFVVLISISLQMGENLNVGTPHLGHLHVLGKSSKAVPGGVLFRGSPNSGS
jgi:hypothetical protein